MKVLYINSVAGRGSTGHLCEDLAKMQDSLLCYGRGNYEGQVPAFRFTDFPGNAAAALNTILFNRNGLSNHAETARLIEKIREFQPDLIHMHNLHGYYVNYEDLFAFLKEAELPVVWTLHDCWAFTGYCPHFEACNCDRYKTQCHDCPYPFAYPFSIFKQGVKEQFGRKKKAFTGLKRLTLVTPSLWLKERVKESFLKEENTEVINNGISLETFCPGAEKDREFSLLAMSGSWTREKGSEDLHELLKQMDPSVPVTIIGNGSKQYERYANTTCLNHTRDQKELAKAYSRAHFLINLTLEDTFPTVNMESLACGTPVITYQSGGSPEIIDEHTGFVIEKHDIAALVRLLGEQRRCETLNSEDCRRRSEALYGQKRMKDAYAALYRNILEERS